MKIIRLCAERFLGNRVEPAHNTFERDEDRNLWFKNHLIDTLVQHDKFGCYAIKKEYINIFKGLSSRRVPRWNSNYLHDKQLLKKIFLSEIRNIIISDKRNIDSLAKFPIYEAFDFMQIFFSRNILIYFSPFGKKINIYKVFVTIIKLKIPYPNP